MVAAAAPPAGRPDGVPVRGRGPQRPPHDDHRPGQPAARAGRVRRQVGASSSPATAAPAWLDAPASTAASDARDRRAAARRDVSGTLWSPAGLDRGRPRAAARRARRPGVRGARRLHAVPRRRRSRPALLPPAAGRAARPAATATTWYSANPALRRRPLATAVLRALPPATVADRRRRQPRRAGDAARAPHAPGRRSTALFLQSGQLLHPGARPAGVRVLAASPRSPSSSPRCTSADVRRASGADGAHLRRRSRRTSPTTRRWPRRSAGSATPTQLVQVRDAHNYTAWRDALHPHLTDLISTRGRRACGVSRSSSAPGTLIAYGHYGRPVLVFPSEQGRAWDFENNGMVDAVADLIDARTGQALLRRQRRRVTLVGPLRADRGARPPPRRLRGVGLQTRSSPWIADDCGGAARDRHARLQPRRLPRGELRAEARATCSRSRLCLSGNYDPTTWHAWGEQGDATYFNNPMAYVANLDGDHLDWLRERVSLLLVVGQGAWEVSPTAALPSTRAFADVLSQQGNPARARRVGLRRPARLAVLAGAAAPPPAAVLLRRHRREHDHI